MNRYLFSILIMFGVFTRLIAQESNPKPTFPWSGKTEIGLNMTNLATRFIPLNFNNSALQDIAIKYRKYRRTNAFKLDIGARVSDSNDSERQFIFVSTGIEKRRNIYKEKWTYVSSFEFTILAGPDNGIFGLTKGYGIEYSINEKIFLSTQTAIIFGAVLENGLGLKISPPNSVFLNIRF